MSLNGVSLAFITETWLNDNIDDAAVHIPTYSVAIDVTGFQGLVEGFALLLNRTSLLKYSPSYMMTILRHFGYISDHINYFEDFRI